MKKKVSLRWPWLAVPVAGAALCALARRWQLATAFEGDLHLSIPFAPASVVLVVLVLACAAALFLLARQQPIARALRKSPRPAAFHAHGSKVVMAALVVSAFLCLVAVPLLFNQGRLMREAFLAAQAQGETVPGGNNGTLCLITAVTSLLAFAGLLVGGKAIYRGLEKGHLALLLPVANGCLWIMDIYRSHAAYPVLWEYVPLMLAIISGIMLYLEWAGLCVGQANPRRGLWTAGMCIVLSVIALAGYWDFSSALLLLSQIVAALAMLWYLPDNLTRAPAPTPVEVPEDEELEDASHE